MAKNTDAQGETKSHPHEVERLPRVHCWRCGLSGVHAMFGQDETQTGHWKCRNAVACRKRALKNGMRGTT